MKKTLLLVTFFCGAAITLSCDVTHADAVNVLEPLLEQGDLKGAAKAMLGRVDRDKVDDEAWLGLGVTRFLQAVEGLAQRNQKFGVLSQYAGAIPLLRLPVPPNYRPEEVTYEDVRPWARSIKDKTSRPDNDPERMPPWFIEKNVGVQRFKNDISLSREEIGRIAAWVDAGAPRGDPGDMPPPIDCAKSVYTSPAAGSTTPSARRRGDELDFGSTSELSALSRSTSTVGPPSPPIDAMTFRSTGSALSRFTSSGRLKISSTPSLRALGRLTIPGP